MHTLPNRTKDKKYFIFFVAALLSFVVSLTLPTRIALAQNDNFSWKAYNTIQFSGGDLGNGTLTAGNVSNVTYQNKCILSLLTTLLSNSSAVIRTTNNGSASSSTNKSLPNCGAFDKNNNPMFPGVEQGYNNIRISISGDRPSANNNQPETEQQKLVGIYLHTYQGQSQPDSVTFTIKDSSGKVVKALKDSKSSTSGPNTYIANTSLEPGSYQICFSSLISGCQSFTKVKYKQLTLNYGSTTDTTLVNVDLSVNPTVNGTDTATVGPFQISLTDSNGNVQTITTGSKQLQGNGGGGVITSEFKVGFKNVKPGTYKVCLVDSTVCQNVEKADGEAANVTLTAGGVDTASAQPGDSGPECGDSTSSLSWIICPVFNLTKSSADTLNGLITNLLDINTSQIFGTDHADGTKATSAESDTAYHFKQAWGSMRNVAILVIVIAALIMIIAQAVGSQAIDAYTIKSVLPRLLIAAIFIALSWYVLEFLVEFSNVLGQGVRTLIYAPFSSLNSGSTSGVMSGVGGIGALLGGGLAISVGVILLLSFAGTILLALLIGLLVIVLRQVVVIFLIIVAPIAIAAYALPGTKKGFSLWWSSLFKALMMFPLIVAFIAVGRVFAAVLLAHGGWVQVIIAIIAYVIPFFLLPFTLKLSGGAMAAVGGALHTQSQRVNGMISKRRGERWGRRREKALSYNAFKGGTDSNFRGRLNRGLGNVLNSGRADLGLSPSRWRSQSAAYRQKLMAAGAAEMLKNDDGRAGGNDAATALASQEGMTAEEFIRQYQVIGNNGAGASLAESRAALATLESSFGARVGTNVMRVAAYKARVGSVTGFTGDDAGKRELFESAGDMVRSGLMTEDDAMAAIKTNRARVDQSGISFGAGRNLIRQVAGGGGISQADIDTVMDTVVEGLNPQSLIGARRESGAAVAPHVMRTLDAAYASGDTRRIAFTLGDIAGMQDVMNSHSPQMAREFTDAVFAQPAGTTGTTVRDAIDRLRATQDANFNDRRKEWLGGIPPGTPPGAPPPPAAPGGGGGPAGLAGGP